MQLFFDNSGVVIYACKFVILIVLLPAIPHIELMAMLNKLSLFQTPYVSNIISVIRSFQNDLKSVLYKTCLCASLDINIRSIMTITGSYSIYLSTKPLQFSCKAG